jgi:hypothetical protein
MLRFKEPLALETLTMCGFFSHVFTTSSNISICVSFNNAHLELFSTSDTPIDYHLFLSGESLYAFLESLLLLLDSDRI